MSRRLSVAMEHRIFHDIVRYMIFPTLKGQPHGEVNYNDLANEWFKAHPQASDAPNPFVDPKAQQELIDAYHRAAGIAFSHGGWLEDRSVIWKGTYLDQNQAYIHLGNDVNAPAGTPIASDNEAEVAFIGDDHPLVGGWGPHIILKLKNESLFVIYGHLDPDISCKVGDSIKNNDVFAKVGPTSHNGNWLPHVHVQSLTPEAYDMFLTPESIDGYARADEIEKYARLSPDPAPFIRFD